MCLWGAHVMAPGAPLVAAAAEVDISMGAQTCLVMTSVLKHIPPFSVLSARVPSLMPQEPSGCAHKCI